MPDAGKHNDPPECTTLRAGMPKIGIWCMIFNDFSKVVIVLVYENVCWIRY